MFPCHSDQDIDNNKHHFSELERKEGKHNYNEIETKVKALKDLTGRGHDNMITS